MDMMDRMQSKFLKFIIYTYGNIGLQFQPIHLKQWKSIVNVIVNIIITLIIVYGLHISERHNRLHSSKKFLTNFTWLCFSYLFSTVLFIIYLHYLIYGRRLIYLMNNIGNRYYHSIYRYSPYLLTILASIELVYVITTLPNFENFSFRQFIDKLSRYHTKGQIHLVFNLIIFHQCCIRQFLLTKINNFSKFKTMKNVSIRIILKFFNEMTNVAFWSRQINQILSIHCLLIIIIVVIHHIIFICNIIEKRSIEKLHLLLPISTMNGYLCFIFILNNGNHQRIIQIRNIILKSYWNQLDSRITAKQQREIHEKISPINPIQSFELIEIYRKDFLVNICHFWKFNFSFLLSMIVFIMNYVVFIVSTN
ncbi:hypothetical protein DERP_005352 [Dermatophagoides pteronyssinus]|uniref:Gustatory receptor n=1 Tax=Dermatophagoides pteronyssinus TaxID=6956 RepID=A0ABQ8JMD9_DERPT|nr:hypothetical protein DERP_005352 [Dermatophagoides pteronyssinus]